MKYLILLLIAVILTGCATTQSTQKFKEYKYVTVTDKVWPVSDETGTAGITPWPVHSAGISNEMSQDGWTLLDVEKIENLKRKPGERGIEGGRTLLLVFGR